MSRERLWWVVDGVAAVALAVAVLVGLSGADTRPAPLPLGYVLVAVHMLSLALRRRFPLAVLAVMAGTGALLPHLGMPPAVTGPVILLAIYTVATAYPPAASLGALGAAVIALIVQGFDLGGTLTWASIMGGTWFLGHYVRTRRRYTEALEQRAAQLQQAREELADQAVAAERLRIARELHDVVAHAMSVIAVQSGVGAHVIDTQPEEARRALKAIEEASRSGLAELRRLLGVLRDDGDGSGRPALAPAPGLGDLPRLVKLTSEAGVEVDVRVEGEARPLPAGVDLAAYRIVQEALTNVVKHAGVGRATVLLRYTDVDVAIEVVDEGIGTSNGVGGHGIVGMQERASLYGGTLSAGPHPGGGFRVTARLPA